MCMCMCYVHVYVCLESDRMMMKLVMVDVISDNIVWIGWKGKDIY